jgi:hypothetical protein
MEHVGSAGLSIGGGVASRLTDCVPFDLIRDFGRRAWPSAGSATSIHDGGDSLLVPRDDRQVLLLSPPGELRTEPYNQATLSKAFITPL